MSDVPLPPSHSASAEAENHALREENWGLRAQQVTATTHEGEQARFRTVFENSPLGQKIITPDLTIRQANSAVVEMLGCSSVEDLVGRKIMDFAHPDHRADWQQLQERLWEHKMPAFTLETCMVRTDGSSYWCQVHSVLFPDEGGELGYTILEDISVRKNLETKLKRLYDAQETILQLATHDMKAPVAQIELLVDLLQREVASRAGGGPPPQEMVHFLGLIQRACAHATSLLQDVLYVGDLDEHSLAKQPTDLNAFLTTRLEMHRLAAEEQGITLTLDLPDDRLYGRLHADKFGRVLDNLLGNALKFTPAGGTVTLGAHKHEGKVQLTVQDTGIGIPSKLHSNLFDKFNPTRRQGLHGEPTTGLGLFIARQIVQLHGGHIWLESREQEGTTFFIELA